MSAPVDLVATNAALHRHLESLWLAAMVELTALRLPEAREAWRRFGEHLEAHAAVEDTLALPVYERLSTFPRGGAPENFTLEHAKLVELTAACTAILNRLGGERGEMIGVLDHFLRVKALFEHHDLREQTHLYPQLVDVPDLGHALSAQLDAWGIGQVR